MKIRKQIFSVVVILVVVLASSCIINTKVGTVYDDTVPADKAAWINLYNVGTVVGYNGIGVQWKTGMSEAIQIPSGDTTLELNIEASVGYTQYKGTGMIFKYNFQAQKQYRFVVGQKDDAYGLNVYTYDVGEKITSGNFNDHLTGFVPFVNSGKNNKTVLN